MTLLCGTDGSRDSLAVGRRLGMAATSLTDPSFFHVTLSLPLSCHSIDRP